MNILSTIFLGNATNNYKLWDNANMPPRKISGTATEQLGDMTEEESTPPVKVSAPIDSQYSCKDLADAQIKAVEITRLAEFLYNWQVRENANRSPDDQLQFIAIAPSYATKALIRDGKPVVDADGNRLIEQPFVNMQLKFNLGFDAISVPLHLSVLIPGVENNG